MKIGLRSKPFSKPSFRRLVPELHRAVRDQQRMPQVGGEAFDGGRRNLRCFSKHGDGDRRAKGGKADTDIIDLITFNVAQLCHTLVEELPNRVRHGPGVRSQSQ